MSPEYNRRYRATVKAKRERRAHQAGVQEGVEMACKLLRELIGGRAITGHEAAVAVAKALTTTQRS